MLSIHLVKNVMMNQETALDWEGRVRANVLRDRSLLLRECMVWTVAGELTLGVLYLIKESYVATLGRKVLRSRP